MTLSAQEEPSIRKPIAGSVLIIALLASCGSLQKTAQPGQARPYRVNEAAHQARAATPRIMQAQAVRDTKRSRFQSAPTSTAPLAFGPHTFVRTNGEPQAETVKFTVPHAGEYVIEVDNGSDANSPSSSARVTLNDTPVFQPSEFNQNVHQLSRHVQLNANNTLTVELSGQPGSALSVRVRALKPNVQRGQVGGQVLAADGAPLANVAVTLEFTGDGTSFQATSDASGAFTLGDLPLNGNFILRASAPGFAGSLSGYVLPSAPSATVTLVLAPTGSGVVSGSVLDAQGQPAARANVSVAFVETGFTASVFTDASGNYRLEGLPTDGSFLISAFEPKSVAAVAQFSYLSGGRTAQIIDLRLNPAPQVNPELTNGFFRNGSLAGWTGRGDVRVQRLPDTVVAAISPKLSAQNLTASSLSPSDCEPQRYAGMANLRRRVQRVQRTQPVLRGATVANEAARLGALPLQ